MYDVVVVGGGLASTASTSARKDLGVVDDEQIASAQQTGEGADDGMRQRPIVAMEMQQPGGAAFGRRLLRDQLWRKVEVELADVHPRVS